MKLGSKFRSFLRTETPLLKRHYHVFVVDGATHSQKNVVESNGSSSNTHSQADVAEAFVLFLRRAQLVLRSSVLTVLDLNEINVTLENAEIFGLVLGAVWRRWICWWRLAGGFTKAHLHNSMLYFCQRLGTLSS